VHVNAVDAAGNRASFDALPFVRATSTLKGRAAQSAAQSPTEVARPPEFLVGAGVADPSQAASAAQSVRLVRFGLTWPPGATAVDATTAAALQAVPSTMSSLIQLTATPLPADDAGRAAFGQYAASIAAQVPSLRALVLAPPATGATGPNYVAALTAIRAALPDTPLGLALDGATDARGAVAALAGLPVELVAFRPAPAPRSGLWTLADLAQVHSAFPDAEIVIDGAPAPFAATLKTAACTPGVTGVLFDRLGDLSRAGIPAAIRTAEHGTFVCPGVTYEALPFAVEFPTELVSPVAVSVACNRDCLYLVTLDRADGRPAVARRGQIAAGSKPTSVALPKVKLPPGAYRVDVRLVARVNPGPVTRYLGPPSTVP
jgi:hypothetical protein